MASDLGPIGGMERVGFEITRRLVERGWDVTVIARSNEVRGVRFVRLRAPSRPVSLAIALSYVQGSFALLRHRRGLVQLHNPVVANHVDVVTAHFCEAAYRERVGLSRSSRPTLAFRVNSWLASAMDLLAERHTYGGARARCVVAVSGGTERELRHYFPVTTTTVITNGVDRKRFAPDPAARRAVRDRLRVPEAAPLAVFAGGDWGRKGLAHAIAAVARAPEWHLAVIGRGDAESFGALAHVEGAGDRVHFTGMVSDPEAHFAAADALVLPSSYEAFSLVTLEAAACGLALLVQRINGTEELVEEGVNGHFVTADAANIAQRLNELGADRARLTALGAAARESTVSYSWDAVAERYDALLTQLAEAGVT